jgi:Lar family restriction alleviation protein
MEKLSSCPFCGATNSSLQLNTVVNGVFQSEYFRVECIQCNTHGPDAATKEMAVGRWNKRFETPKGIELTDAEKKAAQDGRNGFVRAVFSITHRCRVSEYVAEKFVLNYLDMK